jgi:hypothetical protein
MIRRATLLDVPAVVKLGIEALEREKEPGLVICPDRCRAMAIECISKNSNFGFVSEINGEVVAALGAQVSELLFYERNQATVVQYYSKVPGEGIKLMREFLRWVEPRRGIKIVCFMVEVIQDPRTKKLLSRLGFKVSEEVWTKQR